MKSLKPILFSLSLMSAVLLFSCQKSDLKEQLPAGNAATTASMINLKESSWQSLSNWTKVDQQDYSIYYTAIKDASITSDVSDNGLVLVYKKDAATNTSVQLPFEEKVGSNTYYWYYQVSDGKVLVSCDIYGGGNAQSLGTANTFKYIPVSKDALSQLEAKGYSRTQLMQTPYEQVAVLANGTLK